MSLQERYRAKLRRLGMGAFDERLAALFDEGSCSLAPGEGWDRAVVLAEGQVHGRRILAYACNPFVQEASIGEAEALAIAGQLERGVAEGLPVVGLWHSLGAREAEHHAALAANARMFTAITRASGRTPHLTACLGPSFGVAAYAATLADVAWAVARGVAISTTSPAVIAAATGRPTSLEELGGVGMHAAESGMLHGLAPDEASCLAGLRALLAFAAPPAAPFPAAAPGGAPLAEVLPAAPHRPFDVRLAIAALVDGGSFLELQPAWGGALVTGFARLGGRPVALLANQSAVKGGVLDVEAARKGARFALLAEAWGLPTLYLVDVPGLLATPEQERAGLLRAGAAFYQAVDVEVPRISLVLRKCYGGAFVMLQPRQAGGDRVLALEGAQIAVAGPQAAFAMRHGRAHATHADPAAFKREALEALAARPSDARAAQAAGLVDEVVAPEGARGALLRALAEVGDRPPRPERLRRRAIWP